MWARECARPQAGVTNTSECKMHVVAWEDLESRTKLRLRQAIETNGEEAYLERLLSACGVSPNSKTQCAKSRTDEYLIDDGWQQDALAV